MTFPSAFHFFFAIFLLLLPQTLAQTCNATSLCPSTAPCCSEYGYCGVGAYCLGGCEPLFSYKTTSCRPNPLCETETTDFTDLSRVMMNATGYDGNATAYDWIVNTGSLEPADGGARLILTQNNSGTKISSTRYIHYGSIDFVMEASKWAGVVTAAITMSDVKDEIDWEWPGVCGSQVQTNYWYLGVANYSATEGQGITVNSDTASSFHTYTLDWQEDYLNWSVDGNVVRTLLKSDTLSDGVYKYPSTPSRIQISIWPAGISSSAQGTIDWAGGMIDWTNSDYTTNGYFWNTLQSVKISCADDGNATVGSTGWAYGDGNATVGLAVDLTNASLMISGDREVVSVPRVLSWVLGMILGAAGWGISVSI